MRVASFRSVVTAAALAQLAAAPATAQWVVPFSGPGFDSLSEPATDASGAVYVVGTFQGVVSVAGTLLQATGERSLALFKLDAAGAPSWARAVGGEFVGPRIAVQPDGRAVVAGAFDDEVDFGDGPLFGLTFQYFVAHFDPDGGLRVSSAGSGGGQTTVDGMGVAADGVVTVAGAFNSTVDLGAGPMTATFNSTNLYVARYAPDGAPLSSFQHGGPPEDHPLDAAVTPDGGVLVAGFFGGRDTNLGGAELAAGGGSDGFVASYDAAGGHRWSHGLATPGDESAMGVAATPDGGAVVVGGFDDALPLGEGLLSGGEQDGFVVRYDAAGAVLWARSLSGPGMDALRGVAVADDGSVYVGGTFSDSASLAGRSIVSAGGGDIVVARFTADGELAGILTAGGPGADSANTLSVGPSGELYVTGSFEGEAALPGGTLSAAGSTDAFLARLDPADLD